MAPPKTIKPVVQARLNFAATKSSASSAKPKQKAADVDVSKPSTGLRQQLIKPATTETPSVSKPVVKKRRAASESDEDDDNDDDLDFRVDVDSDVEDTGPAELGNLGKDVSTPEPDVHDASSTSEDEERFTASAKHRAAVKSIKELLKDEEFKDGHKEAMKAVGGDLIGDAKGERKAATILRVFDLSYEYGPCVGFTRMERWERASKLGLDPPEIVRRILESEKAGGLTDEEAEALRQPVFHGLV